MRNYFKLKTNKMKKLTVILVLALFIATSCSKEKCVTCTEIQTGKEIHFCGSKSDRKDFEQMLHQIGGAIGSTWTCEESE